MAVMLFFFLLSAAKMMRWSFQVPGRSSVYHINVCGEVAEPACRKSAVCQVSSSGSKKLISSFGISQAMTMDFKHEEEAVLMKYGGGDPCPPGTSAALSLTQFVKRRILVFLNLSTVFTFERFTKYMFFSFVSGNKYVFG